MLLDRLFGKDSPKECSFITKYIVDEQLSNISSTPEQFRKDLLTITSDYTLDVTVVDSRRRTERYTMPALTIIFANSTDNTAFTLKYGHKYQYTDDQSWTYI